MCGIFSILGNTDLLNREDFNRGSCRGPESMSLTNIDSNTVFGFHRLAINGLNQESDQPLDINNISLICNGEIYNYKQLYQILGITGKTDSDCEIIIHMYQKYGIKETLLLLDGVFAFVLYDKNTQFIYVARDPYGVRPLYMNTVFPQDSNMFQCTYMFSSEMKMFPNCDGKITCFSPGNYMVLRNTPHWEYLSCHRYVHEPCIQYFLDNEIQIYIQIREALEQAVIKRVQNTDRPVACLLSGGLDSSLVAALVAKNIGNTILKTFSIGMEGSEDLIRAEEVAEHIGSEHVSVVMSEQEFFSAIPEVIEAIESYDTTTVRASVGNYLIAKYIAEHTDCKVILNGDGADELMGGYLYFHSCPDELTFDKECRRLLNDIYQFDVLRSDRSISSNGLEPRTPYLDRGWVQFYLSIPAKWRYHVNHGGIEKYLVRNAFAGTDLLPESILWRRKEAFSDGVSKQSRSWYEIIQEKIPFHVLSVFSLETMNSMYGHNIPQTAEQYYYRLIFDKYYAEQGACMTIPYFWMPNFVEASDSSARTLAVY